jgi:hypothetical protein
LTHLNESCIMMQVRITLFIDRELLDGAPRLTGMQEKIALVRAHLKALIAPEAVKRLGALGGAEPNLLSILRRPGHHP